MIPIYLIYLGGLGLFITLAGFLIVKQGLTGLAWATMIASVYCAQAIVSHQQPLLRMMAIIGITFTGMKIVTATQDYKNMQFKLKFFQWLAFVLGWAGMRARPFESLFSKPLPRGLNMMVFGITRLAMGIILIVIAHHLMYLHGALSYALISVLLLVGLSLVLHFGALSISAGFWRLAGVDVQLLFNKPAKAITLTEFWGRRWNLAFSQMAAISIFRPLKPKLGEVAALMLVFIFSGLAHELAISLPVKSGYGLPLLYFVIQGLGVVIEKYLINQNATILQHKIIAKIWTLCWIILPVPLLFHVAFMQQVIWVLGGK